MPNGEKSMKVQFLIMQTLSAYLKKLGLVIIILKNHPPLK